MTEWSKRQFVYRIGVYYFDVMSLSQFVGTIHINKFLKLYDAFVLCVYVMSFKAMI